VTDEEMSMRVPCLRPIGLVLMLMLSSAPAGGRDHKPAFPLAVGRSMPHPITEFVSGFDRGEEGIPPVMLHNGNARGIIIWSRGFDDSAFALAKALEAWPVDDVRFRAFYVAFDADKAQLATRSKAFKRVVVGRSRLPAKRAIDRQGISADVRVLIFLLERSTVKSMWTFKARELNEANVKEALRAAREFAAGKK
jgi:hypothetical protein